MDLIYYNLSEEVIFNSACEINENNEFTKSDILILHVNIRSISKNVSTKISLNLDSLICKLQNKPDVIICSEAWLKYRMDSINLPDYVHFNNKSRLNRSDGVIMFIKKTLKYQTVTEKFNELKTVSAIIQLNNKSSVKITGIYRFHHYEIDVFIKDFNQFILNNKQESNHVIIGNVNIDLNKFDAKSEEYFYNLLQKGYQIMINSCTHPLRDADTGTCIDHIFVKSNYHSTAGKIYESITDHYPVLLSFHGNSIKCVEKENDKLINKKFIKLCETENWNEVYEVENNIEALDLLIEKIQNICKNSIKSITKSQKPLKNWITPGLMNSINKKNQLYKLWNED